MSSCQRKIQICFEKKKKTKTGKEKSDLFLKSVNKKKDLSRKLDVYCEREKE